MQIPQSSLIKKLPSRMVSEIMQDIDGFGYLPNDDLGRKEQYSYIKTTLRKYGVNHIDFFHITDAVPALIQKRGVLGSAVNVVGGSVGSVRDKAVYGFLDIDDVSIGYAGVLGSSSECPNIIHIELPIRYIDKLRWDSNFNITFGTYSAVSVAGNKIPSSLINTIYESVACTCLKGGGVMSKKNPRRWTGSALGGMPVGKIGRKTYIRGWVV